MKLDHLLTAHTKHIQNGLNTNIGTKIIKILGENISSKISDVARSYILSNISSQTKETKENKQIGLHQTKKFLYSKGNHQ